jgi:DNA-binding NarL/FixJ family response regulator
MTVRFLIAEDHPLFAEALQMAILSNWTDAQVARAGTLQETRDALAEREDYDLVLLDLWLPDTHGFEALVELRARYPKLPIVVVSAFADPGVVEKSVICGATGFIPKSARKEALVQAIRDVLDGDVAFPHAVLSPESVADMERDALTDRLQSLTPQQVRVLQMLCQGLLNKQIAHELEVGETTVKAHISEILRKLHVVSRTQAVLEVSKLNFGAVLALYTSEVAPCSQSDIERAN